MIEKPLYIFSDHYPYGDGEVFLHNEVKELSSHFKRIILIPRFKRNSQRNLPKNVEVLDIFTKISWFQYGLTLLKNCGFVRYYRSFVKEFLRLKKHTLKSLVTFFGYCLQGSIYHKRLSELNIDNSILYSYWFKHSAFAISKLNGETNFKFVRCHRGDLYENEYTLPFRKLISCNVDMLIPISQHGKAHLQKVYNISKDKIIVNRLGTYKEYDNKSAIENSSTFNLVSCSALIPRKRVNIILESLQVVASKHEDLNFNYHHFGDGPMFKSIQKKSENSPSNLKVYLMGSRSNSDIQKFYSSEPIQLFVNFSTSEGIPVSIMEAISYGIPILAANVGGTSEIVQPPVGVLIDSSVSALTLSDSIMQTIKDFKDTNRETIINFWRQNYSATENYKSLVNFFETYGT